jgi:chromosome segregation ATPase
MSVIRDLERQKKALESEIKRLEEKIALYQEELPRLFDRLAEIEEVIEHVRQLPRYRQNDTTDSVPQKE